VQILYFFVLMTTPNMLPTSCAVQTAHSFSTT
jgi:hypothetical protein